MKKERTAIDNLIEPCIDAVVARNRPTFTKSQVLREVLAHRNLAGVLDDIGRRYGKKWHFDEVIRRYIENKVGSALQKRDSNHIRIYECYSVPGERERRWMPLSAMNRDALRAVMRETRTQERQLHIKGEGYQFFLEELERLGPSATVDNVYHLAVPKILAQRGHSGNAGAA